MLKINGKTLVMNCSNYKSNDGICISVQPLLDNPLINVDDNVKKTSLKCGTKKYDPCPGI